MSLRERVSPEALARAIKARVALTHGVHSPGITYPMPIARAPVAPNGLNWQLADDDIPSELRPVLLTAASTVASAFNLA